MGSKEPSKDSLYETLKILVETPSPSGHEDLIRERVKEMLAPYVDEVRVDALGNLIALKRGSGKGRLMIAAHMDEIGLMINYVTKEGFLKFVPIGGWSDRILPAQRVLIRTKDGRFIRGVIGTKPPHIMKKEEADKVIPMKELFIDIGASSREEAEKLGVGVGSVAVIERDIARLGNGDIVTARAFDDKVGLAVMIETMKTLTDTEVSVYAVATVQEEVGLKGARVAAHAISPHIGIALDVTVASDVHGVPEEQQITRIGAGPAIKIMDGRSGTGHIAHPQIRKMLIETAEKHNIPYQLEVLPGGTTDAAAIQLTKDGVPTGTISIPTRYIHSPVELLNLNDAVNATKLLKHFIEELKDEILKTKFSANT